MHIYAYDKDAYRRERNGLVSHMQTQTVTKSEGEKNLLGHFHSDSLGEI